LRTEKYYYQCTINNNNNKLNRFPTKNCHARNITHEVHHWLKRRSTREERKPVKRDDNNNNNLSHYNHAVAKWERIYSS
jgi:hypothetical protein